MGPLGKGGGHWREETQDEAPGTPTFRGWALQEGPGTSAAHSSFLEEHNHRHKTISQLLRMWEGGHIFLIKLKIM